MQRLTHRWKETDRCIETDREKRHRETNMWCRESERVMGGERKQMLEGKRKPGIGEKKPLRERKRVTKEGEKMREKQVME